MTSPIYATATEETDFSNPASFGLSTGSVVSDVATGSLDLDQSFDELMKKSMEIAGEFQQGKIPQEAIDLIEQTTAEQSLSRGLGTGSAARGLTARDLGRSVVDLQTTGVQLANQTAAAIENKRQFNTSLQKQIDMYNTDNALKVNQFLTASDLTQDQMQSNEKMFNASQALSTTQMIVNMAQFGQQLQERYAELSVTAGDIDTSGLQKDIQNILSDLTKLLG